MALGIGPECIQNVAYDMGVSVIELARHYKEKQYKPTMVL
jgi:hypothetical protein